LLMLNGHSFAQNTSIFTSKHPQHYRSALARSSYYHRKSTQPLFSDIIYLKCLYCIVIGGGLLVPDSKEDLAFPLSFRKHIRFTNERLILEVLHLFNNAAVLIQTYSTGTAETMEKGLKPTVIASLHTKWSIVVSAPSQIAEASGRSKSGEQTEIVE